MTDFRDQLGRLVADIEPLDDLEAADQAACLAWIASGAPLCRIEKPATPPQHLVAYAVAVDPARAQVLLVDHRQAELWLPTGGHVEPDEHPAVAARRELREELAIDSGPLAGDTPVMVTRTTAAGNTTRHVDVSLWYAFHVDATTPLQPDAGEFAAVCWRPFESVRSGAVDRLGPNVDRFLAKAAGLLASA